MRTPRIALLAATLSILSILTFQPSVARRADDRAIQPGARLTRPDLEPAGNRLPYKFDRCTISFIFQDSRHRLYTGTTGERGCVPAVGATVYDAHSEPFGTAVFREYSPPDASFTLIEIYPSRYGDVNPAVRHWGGPTGVAPPSQEHRGDAILYTGQGWVEGDLPWTRPRRGVLRSYDAAHFTADTTAVFGDSGAPIIDASNGLAVGMISAFGTANRPPTTDDGPTVLRILHDLAVNGFRLTLVTAPMATRPLG